jgi:hypothetical protein
MLFHDTFIYQLFKKDPSIGHCVHINIRLIALEKYFYQLHLEGADLAKCDFFADLRMRLLELSVQLVLLALRVYERQDRHLIRWQRYHMYMLALSEGAIVKVDGLVFEPSLLLFEPISIVLLIARRFFALFGLATIIVTVRAA